MSIAIKEFERHAEIKLTNGNQVLAFVVTKSELKEIVRRGSKILKK